MQNDSSIIQSSESTIHPCKIAREISLGLAIFIFFESPSLVRLKLKVHKYALCSLEKSFVVRVIVLVRLKGFVLSAIVSANPHWRGVGWLEFEKFSLLDLPELYLVHGIRYVRLIQENR